MNEIRPIIMPPLFSQTPVKERRSGEQIFACGQIVFDAELSTPSPSIYVRTGRTLCRSVGLLRIPE
jgi:hypothetical protein